MVEEHNRKNYYKKKIYKKKLYRTKGDKTENILYEKNIYKALFTTAFPLTASNFIIALLDVTDTFFIGRLDNSASAQAAMGAAWPIINIMLAFNNGLAAAGVAAVWWAKRTMREPENRQEFWWGWHLRWGRR